MSTLPIDLMRLVLQYCPRLGRIPVLLALLELNYFTGDNFYDLRKIQDLCS